MRDGSGRRIDMRGDSNARMGNDGDLLRVHALLTRLSIRRRNRE